ncbi:MAG: hypothetical protein SNJ64_05680 [Endomicrobiia bacterium]
MSDVYEKKYQSFFSPHKIDVIHYIVELVFCNYSRVKKIHLPQFFWRSREYAKIYGLYVILTRSFIKVVSPQAMINVIRRKNIYSLKAKFLPDEFLKEEEKLRKQSQLIELQRKTYSEDMSNQSSPQKYLGKYIKPQKEID